ncbi:UNVERIFIED_CONTAM: hypothetical protein PYX00_004159 [Menopon gallinae]|uniref:Uncharacterized protein n=1 Tax=Menopon gallinae TaxID=328185 RepID=A0AAW2I581_9NEOP
MAFLSMRLCRGLRSRLALSSRCFASEKDIALADPLEIATGKERQELLAMQAGDDDPFKTKAIKRRPSTKSDPIAVPSYHDSRIVGCICEEETGHIKWFWLHDGEPKRCYCGHWFKLEKFQSP